MQSSSALLHYLTPQGMALKGDREIHLSRIHQKQRNIVVAIWSASNAITLKNLCARGWGIIVDFFMGGEDGGTKLGFIKQKFFSQLDPK